MKNNPFLHENLELKNELVAYARKFMGRVSEPKSEWNDEDVAAVLAAGLLYANLADYLAASLLRGLEEMVKVSSREYLNGTIVYRNSTSLDKPLEKTIKGLKQFDFPSRETILKLLQEVRKNRNILAHEMFKRNNSEEIGEAAGKLAKEVESLVEEINALYRSMPPKTIVDQG